MEILCLVPLFFALWFYFAYIEPQEKSQKTIDPNSDPNQQPNSAGYVVWRQRHGFGVNPNPTDMGTFTSAKLYNFPNGPNGPNGPKH